MLAQLGAEVLKIESPKRIDYAREAAMKIDGSSALFHMINHLKKPLMVDYQSDEGYRQVIEHIASSDVLIEQFRPGAMDAWNLGYEKLKVDYPSLIYVSLTGYGQEGTMRGAAGHDLNYLSLSGLLGMIRDDKDKPVIPGFQLADIGSGSYMTVTAILGALYRREKSGKGCHIDVSMTRACTPLLQTPLALSQSGMDPKIFNVLDGRKIVNYAVYQCADGKWISVGALEVKFWNELCDVIDKGEWKRSHILELTVDQFPRDEVVAYFKTKNRDEWIDLLKDADACVTPVLDLSEALESELFSEQGYMDSFQTKSGHSLFSIGSPFTYKE